MNPSIHADQLNGRESSGRDAGTGKGAVTELHTSGISAYPGIGTSIGTICYFTSASWLFLPVNFHDYTYDSLIIAPL
jgi:hypothetical protein